MSKKECILDREYIKGRLVSVSVEDGIFLLYINNFYITCFETLAEYDAFMLENLKHYPEYFPV